MPIYTGMINSRPINMGVTDKIYHTLGVDFEGTIISFNDNVTLASDFSGSIISFDDTVTDEFSGTIISFRDTVHQELDFYARNGYQVYIYIGSQLIPDSRYHGKFTCSTAAGGTKSLSFQLLPLHGVQDVTYYQGLPVEVDVQMPDGVWRMFTGYVDSPSVELVDEYITINCTDRRSNRILTQMYSSLCPITSVTDQSAELFDLDTLGYYSVSVFGTPKDTADELEKRMSTIPYDFDFDNYGNVSITSWTPKADADFILDDTPGPHYDNKVYYDGQAIVNRANRAGTLNTVNIAIKHSYMRLHQQCVNVTWSGYDDFLRDWFDRGRPSFPQKTTVESAAANGKWKVMNQINYVDLWPAGGFGGVLWQPNKVVEYTRPQLIFAGYARNIDNSFVTVGGMLVPLYTNVVDPTTHEPFLEVYKTEIVDTSSMLCRGASWRACINFSQNVTEEYNIQMVNPVGVAKFGTVANTESYSVTSPYDTSTWENTGGFINEEVNVYIDQKTNLQEVNFALEVALTKGRMELMKANRDATVTFNRSIWPQLETYHTVELDIFACQTKGRVSRIQHNIDFSTGIATSNIQLALSLSEEQISDTVLSLPAPPTEDPSYIGTTLPDVNLGTHDEIDYANAVDIVRNGWNGAIENVDITQGPTLGAYRTANTTQFIVDYPPIGTNLTGSRDLRGTWHIGNSGIYATTFEDLIFKRSQSTGAAYTYDQAIAYGGIAYGFVGDTITTLTPTQTDNIVVGNSGAIVGDNTSVVGGTKFYFNAYNLLYSRTQAFGFSGSTITSLAPSAGDNLIFGTGDIVIGSDIGDVTGDGGQYHFTADTNIISGQYGVITHTVYNVNIPNDDLVVDLHVYS